MSTGLKRAVAPSRANNVNRMPQQGRSKASLERMVEAARALMLERGNEDFTLQEVSQKGNVSIGSIYLRFKGKDDLVRAVIAEGYEVIAAAEESMFALLADSDTLALFVPRYVDAYAEVLKTLAPILRLSMERASFDPLVSGPGKARAFAAQASTTQAILRFSDEIGGDNKEEKAQSSFHVIFATLARELSLGSTGESAHHYEWNRLKRELGHMCLAYLKAE